LFRFAALGAAALGAWQLSACDGSDAGGEACDDFVLTEEEASHACVHTDDGPFDELGNGEQLGNLHMLYTVSLEPSGSSYAGTVTFIARESAVHAFLLVEDDVPVRVLDGERELCVVVDETDGCDAFASAHLVRLERSEKVTLELGPTSRSSVRVLGERQ
jgi:hypothetical protein